MPPVPPTRQLRKRSTMDARESARRESPSQPISTKPPDGFQTPTNLRHAPFAAERLAVFRLTPVHETHHVFRLAAGRDEIECRFAVVRQIVRHGGADYVAFRVRNADFGDFHLARKGLQGRRVVRMSLVKYFAHRHALADHPFVDAVGYLRLDVFKGAVYERVGVPLGKPVVEEPAERHGKRERRDHAEDELQVQAVPSCHFAPPSAMTELAAARTSGRRLSTATP